MSDERQPSEQWLQEKYGSTKRALSFYDNQVVSVLNETMVAFIGSQEMVFVSTANSQGKCDASIRVGKPGFVCVLDERTLVYPEYRGNGVYASLGNIYENMNIGLLFVDFTSHGIGLHVNGSARIVERIDLLTLLERHPGNTERISDDPQAERFVEITVEEAFIHCSKHIPLMQKVNRNIEWGTDSEEKKGGDFFNVRRNKSDIKT